MEELVSVLVPVKWEVFLRRLADDHGVDLNTIVSELCEWAFQDAEDKEQFKVWLDESYPSRGAGEDAARSAGEEAAEEEEEFEKESEEESDEHRRF